MAKAIRTKNYDMVLVLSTKEAKGLASLAAIARVCIEDSPELAKMFDNSVVKRAGIVAFEELKREIKRL